MAVPKRRVTRSRRDMRRSHHHLTAVTLQFESATDEVHLRHHLSPQGYLRGKACLKVSKAKAPRV